MGNEISMRGLPKAPSKPHAFSRPSIDLGAPKVTKSWQEVPVGEIHEGDIVQDAGLVTRIIRNQNDETKEGKVHLFFQSGAGAIFDFGTTLFSFTEVKNG